MAGQITISTKDIIQFITFLGTIAGLYVAMDRRITVNEQKHAAATEQRQGIKTSLKELKDDINEDLDEIKGNTKEIRDMVSDIATDLY